jgi:hypothetical protein
VLVSAALGIPVLQVDYVVLFASAINAAGPSSSCTRQQVDGDLHAILSAIQQPGTSTPTDCWNSSRLTLSAATAAVSAVQCIDICAREKPPCEYLGSTCESGCYTRFCNDVKDNATLVYSWCIIWPCTVDMTTEEAS